MVSVTTRTVTLPLERAVRNGTARIDHRDYTFVEITDTSGTVGRACAFSRDLPLPAVVNSFHAPRVVGRRVFERERIWADLYADGERFLGRNGIGLRALSLIDIALWDLTGQLLGLPLDALLGGQDADVPLLAAAGYYRAEPDPGHERLSWEYRTLAEQGVTRFKIMAGALSVADDAARIQAAHAAIPAGAGLAVDVNGGWRTASDALRFLDAVAIPVDFIEDPFPPDNLTALAELKRHSPVPIAVGEWESGRRRVRELLERGLVDVVRLDATAVGGVSEWLKAAAVAAAYDVRVLPHYYPEVHRPLAAATPAVEAIEIVPEATGADNFARLCRRGHVLAGPIAVPNPIPGVGIEWDLDVIDRYTVR